MLKRAIADFSRRELLPVHPDHCLTLAIGLGSAVYRAVFPDAPIEFLEEYEAAQIAQSLAYEQQMNATYMSKTTPFLAMDDVPRRIENLQEAVKRLTGEILQLKSSPMKISRRKSRVNKEVYVGLRKIAQESLQSIGREVFESPEFNKSQFAREVIGAWSDLQLKHRGKRPKRLPSDKRVCQIFDEEIEDRSQF